MRHRQSVSAGRDRLSRGVISVAVVLSLLHLLNFLNYTKLSGYFDPPLTRSLLLIASSMFIAVGSMSHLRIHARRSWDMYGLCVLALLSAAFSKDPSRTLMYSAWLTLAVYIGTEMSVRVRTPVDVVAVLAIVLLPASFLVAVANVAMGPVVAGGGRHFGALGSQHVDTAYAMNFVCLFLALRSLPARGAELPQQLKWLMFGILVWSVYQVIFGLTRSVWLGVALATALYMFRRKLDFGTIVGGALVLFVAAVLISFLGIDRVVPDEVKTRIEVTEQRYESGEIDPRVNAIQRGLRAALSNPQGTGYAGLDYHNSYLNMMVQLGWVGFVLAVVAIVRSVMMTWRMGLRWFLFFGIGSAALLLQAFFEVQNTPGQANFVPLLTWYGLSRARFVQQSARAERRRPNFVEA